MLAVKIDDIQVTRGWAWSRFIPGFGVLGIEGNVAGPTGLNEPLPEMEFRWTYNDDLTEASIDLPSSKLGRATIPLHPFLGCIGVCPRFGETIDSLTPSNHGANMDCIETAAGTTVYLPVFVEGALLFFGDGHAAQGDGEACGVALETPTITELTVDVVKDYSIAWPRFENDDYIMTVGNTRPLIDAVRIAKTEMVLWLERDYGFDRWEGFQLLSQVGRVRVGNVVDPKYTIVVKFPKAQLPTP
jgi:acetamidase/formamidase